MERPQEAFEKLEEHRNNVDRILKYCESLEREVEKLKEYRDFVHERGLDPEFIETRLRW